MKNKKMPNYKTPHNKTQVFEGDSDAAAAEAEALRAQLAAADVLVEIERVY